MLFDILSLLSLLIVILNLKRLVNILPSLMACIIRWKESVNLEASVKLSRDRDMMAIAMIIPFCLISVRFKLYNPGFLDRFEEDITIWITIFVFALFYLFRFATIGIFLPRKMNIKVKSTAEKLSNTFFIILTLVLLMTGGIMSFIGIADSTIRLAILWISISIYCIHLLRKLQIFNSYCSVFTAFLYLCALEIIPTGTLVVSALIF